MKRARLILLSMLLGVATTFVVAAGAAVLSGLGETTHLNRLSFQGKFRGDDEPKEGAMYLHQERRNSTTVTEALMATWPLINPEYAEPLDREALPDWCRAAIQPWTGGEKPWPPKDHADWRAIVAAGWPMRALQYEFGPQKSFHRSAWNSSPIVARKGIEVSRNGAAIFAIPYRPLWTGLLVDTAVYAACWFGLAASVKSLRRSARRRRGLCAVCGYSRAGLPTTGAVCPECGADPG